MHQRCVLLTAAVILITALIILIQRTNTPSMNEDTIQRWRERKSRQHEIEQRKLRKLGVFDNLSIRTAGQYEAPLLGSDIKTRAPHSDFVYLHLGYSLESHKQAIMIAGIDLNSAIRHVFAGFESRGTVYSADLDDESLATIRRDVGVDFVGCDHAAWIDDWTPRNQRI